MASYNIRRGASKIHARMIPCFPDEITENILLRIPTECLFEFKCVVKSWGALISSKRFIRAHLQNSNKDVGLVLANHYVSTKKDGKKPILSQYSLQSFIKDSSVDAIDLPQPRCIIDAKSKVYIVGCVNGLCCIIIDDKDYFLWNPCMRTPKRLPDFYDDGKSRKIWNVRYGFGFDETNDDYKVLVNILVVTDGDMCSNECTNLYSLKHNSWKRIEHLGGGINYQARGEFSNGRLHWVKQETDSNSNIVYFDLASDQYGTMELPSLAQRKYTLLGVLDGCLCLLSDDPINKETCLWLYAQYGAQDSLVKLATIPHVGIPDWDGPCFMHTPLCISPAPRGEILLLNRWTFISYHPTRGNFTCLQPNNKSLNPNNLVCWQNGFLNACVWFKSLVSPFTYDEPSETQR